MKKLKKIIIILIILLIVLISVYIVITSISKKEELEQDKKQDAIISLPTYTTKEENDYVFFAIDDTIQLLFDYIQEDNKEAVYGMTDETYIKENNILLENVIETYTNNQQRKYYFAQEIYKIENYDSAIYYIYGMVLEEGKEILDDYYLEMKIKNNSSFSLKPLEKEKYIKAKNGELKEIEDMQIVNNDYNKYSMNTMNKEQICKRYINDYKLKLKYMPEVAFELLEDEYKNSNFDDLNQFKDYIQQNAKRFNEFEIQSCEIEIKEDSRQYTILDTNNNYYQLIIYSALNYKIILDNDS